MFSMVSARFVDVPPMKPKNSSFVVPAHVKTSSVRRLAEIALVGMYFALLEGNPSNGVLAVYWLAMARVEGENPADVLNRAVAQAGYKGMAATLTRDALLRNLDIANKLGCLNGAGLAEMRHGRAATVIAPQLWPTTRRWAGSSPAAAMKAAIDRALSRKATPPPQWPVKPWPA